MNNLLFVGLCFLICYIDEKTTNVKPTIDFENKFEYLPIITANIYADLFIIFATFSRVYYKILTLEDWYKKYRLSAMIADILIGVLYILLKILFFIDFFIFSMITINKNKNNLFNIYEKFIICWIVFFNLLYY